MAGLLIKWLIVLIPVFQITKRDDLDKKCKNRWAWATFGIPLLLTWIAEFMIIVIEGERLPYKFMYKYATVPFWVWVLSAWGIYFYFLYRVNYKKLCKKQTYQMKEVS